MKVINITISRTIFKANGFNSTEIGVMSVSSASVKITRTWFIANVASYIGVIVLDQCNFSSVGVLFYNNTSKYRGILHSEKGLVQFHNTHFFLNTGNFSIIYFVETEATFSEFNFSNNIGSLLALRSKMSFSAKKCISLQ